MPALPKSAPRAAHLAAQGAAIAHARESRGLTQQAAAAALGVPVWTLRSWEHGRRACPPETRRRIVREWRGDREILGPKADACPHCKRAW
jgi:DNA-binding transcriptional regulator YiaG